MSQKEITQKTYISGVHGNGGGRLRDLTGSAVHDIGAPRLVVVAGAVVRAGHLAVAGVKVAAVAQREAVGLVVAEEVRGLGLYQWDIGVVVLNE